MNYETYYQDQESNNAYIPDIDDPRRTVEDEIFEGWLDGQILDIDPIQDHLVDHDNGEVLESAD